MATEVDICNIALSFLGDRATVTSIDPPEGSSPQADHCARFYPMALQEILQSFPWSFATTRATLAELQTKPDTVQFAYALPTNCLRLLYAYGAPGIECRSWTIERSANGLMLVTQEPVSFVVYTTGRVAAAQFPPAFVEALCHLIASKLAGAVIPGGTGMDLMTKHLQAYDLYAQRAMKLDAQQEQEVIRFPTPYTGDLRPYGHYGDCEVDYGF